LAESDQLAIGIGIEQETANPARIRKRIETDLDSDRDSDPE